MKLSQFLVGKEITTLYSRRSGVVVSVERRPVCDLVGVANEFNAYLVKYSPKDENGKVNTDFYNYTTMYFEMEV